MPRRRMTSICRFHTQYNGGDMITLARRDREYERERRDRDRRERSRRGGYSQGSVNTAAIAGAVIGAIIAKNT